MKRELRGFADCAAKNQNRGDGEIAGVARDFREMRNDVVEHDRAGGHPDHQDSNHESEIANARGKKRFLRRFGSGIALEPVADQHVRSEADQFPENEQHHEIVRENDPEHCEHEEGESGEIARFTFVIAHIAQRVDVNQRPDAGNDEQHQSAQIIEDKREWNSEDPANIDPGELARRDVDLAEDRATADKTSENSRD